MEHRVIDLGNSYVSIEDKCNAMSDDGWRLISTYYEYGHVTGIFRRPRR
jgi:hypothetical protein